MGSDIQRHFQPMNMEKSIEDCSVPSMTQVTQSHITEQPWYLLGTKSVVPWDLGQSPPPPAPVTGVVKEEGLLSM